MPTINNYTVTSVVYTAASGSNVYTTHPTAVLTITPNEGYIINANDFSWTNTDLNYINTVVFVQDGDNILCTVTFDNPFTMPASDVDLALCISGSAVEAELCCTIGLSVKSPSSLIGYNIQANSSIPENISFTLCGIENQTVEVFEKTYTCTTGYFWEPSNVPDVFLGGVTNIDSYNVSQINTTNSDGKITSTTITVSYTFGECTNDVIEIQTYLTTQIQTPVVKITNYTLNTSDVGANGIGKMMRVYGAPGATFELTSSNGAILNINTTGTNGSLLTYTTIPIQTIPNTGYFDVYIVIPASGSAAQYCFTLVGDLVDPFPQANPVCINQYSDVTLTFNTTGSNLTVTSTTANSNSQASSTVTKTYPANSIPTIDGEANINKIEWLVQTSSGQLMTIVSSPTVSWTNYDEAYTNNSEEVSLSTIIPVVSATGITTGMRVEGEYVTTDGVPLECTVDAINSTNLTVSPQQLLIPYDPANNIGDDLVFSNRKGSKLNLPVVATLDEAGTTAKIKVAGDISKYGDTSQTFTLDLTSVLSVGAATTCRQWAIAGGDDGGRLTFNNCSGTQTIQDIVKGETFNICGKDSPAATGTGTVTVSNVQACDTSSESTSSTCYSYTVTYNPTSKNSAQTVEVKYHDCGSIVKTVMVGTGTTTICGNRVDLSITDVTGQATWSRGNSGCS